MGENGGEKKRNVMSIVILSSFPKLGTPSPKWLSLRVGNALSPPPHEEGFSTRSRKKKRYLDANLIPRETVKYLRERTSSGKRASQCHFQLYMYILV